MKAFFLFATLLVAVTAQNGSCGTACWTNKDCGTDCWSCKGAAGGGQRGTCISYSNDTCGTQCANNNDCGIPSQNHSCTSCVSGQCQKGAACGSTCGGTDTNCDQTSRCNVCVNLGSSNVCSAGCQQPCDSDANCMSVQDGCTTCITKNNEFQSTCQHFNCGQKCTNGTDCAGFKAGLCTQCSKASGNLTGFCKAPCKGPCRAKTDCIWPCATCNFNMSNGTCNYY